MCVGAWPIIVYQKQLKDHSRRIMEIYEATGQRNGEVCGTRLFRYVVDSTERDGRGRITNIRGHHERCGCISPHLYSTLRDNGAPEELLKRIFPEGKAEEDADET